MAKTVYVGFKFLHMGHHAGYDLIRFHADYDIFLDCQKDFIWIQRLLGQRSLISRIYGRVLGDTLWWVELRCLLLALFNRNLVFHFIYAENIYRFLGWFKWLGFKIVCTYHQPISFYEEHPKYIRGLRLVDDVIVLSQSVVPIFKKWKGDDCVCYIPHGVDSDFFRPGLSQPRQREVLMVGNWLRNFEFADKVFSTLLQSDSEVNVYVVTTKNNLDKFCRHKRLHLLCGITDEELLIRYRSAAMLFLPLDNFVANNTVLEVAAVGCPILIASNQKGYQFPTTPVEILPLKVNDTVKRIIEKLEENDQFVDLRRNWVVQHFSWPTIGKKTRKIILDGTLEHAD